MAPWTPGIDFARVSEAPIQQPFPEARPPHLPDVLTRRSPWVFAFAAVALVQLWRTVGTLIGAPGVDAGTTVLNAVSSIQNIAPPLFGVALFWRHPNARTTMPLLVFGLALFAIVELLAVFDQPIRDVLRTISPPPDETLVLESPAEVAFRVFTSLLSVFALLYTGAGLTAARRRERSAGERPLAIWLVALAIVGTIINIAATSQFEVEVSPLVIVQLVVGIILSVLVTLAWAYLVTVTVGGWMAGETPSRAWGLAALATSILFASRAVFTLLISVPAGDWGLTVLQIVGYVSLVAWLVLLAAFGLGLPSPPDDAQTDATDDPPVATPLGSAAG